MDEQSSELIIKREKIIEKSQSSVRKLMLRNIEGQRKYLHTFLLIIFVAAGFVITIQDHLQGWAVFISVPVYLVCALVLCIYMWLLLRHERDSLEKFYEFGNKQRQDLIDAIKNGIITNTESREKFEDEKRKEEADFRKGNHKDFSNKWFDSINIAFILATFVLLLGYISKYVEIKTHFPTP